MTATAKCGLHVSRTVPTTAWNEYIITFDDVIYSQRALSFVLATRVAAGNGVHDVLLMMRDQFQRLLSFRKQSKINYKSNEIY